ncbi:inorganic diphosphatase [Streptomyces sp. NPDC047028]|uniref:inorganic diphosphatase n=1 Tax=Streptomyces sp. NPDC047028 TaxID=3155793 RepID=UPI0033EB34E7
MEITVAVAATAGSPFAPALEDGPGADDLLSEGSIRVTGYPVGAGWVTDSLTEEGRPAAALLLMEEPALPGQSVRARPVALVHAEVDGQPRVEVVCVPAHDANFAGLSDVAALRAWRADEGTLAAVLHRLDRGHQWRITACDGIEAAETFLAEARHAYERLAGGQERKPGR